MMRRHGMLHYMMMGVVHHMRGDVLRRAHCVRIAFMRGHSCADDGRRGGGGCHRCGARVGSLSRRSLGRLFGTGGAFVGNRGLLLCVSSLVLRSIGLGMRRIDLLRGVSGFAVLRGANCFVGHRRGMVSRSDRVFLVTGCKVFTRFG